MVGATVELHSTDWRPISIDDDDTDFSDNDGSQTLAVSTDVN